MPYGDRTGPYGEGAITGRGPGRCAGHDASGALVPCGRGIDRGAGRGDRNWYRATGLTGRQRVAGWGVGRVGDPGTLYPVRAPVDVAPTRGRRIATLRAQADAAEATAAELRAAAADLEREKVGD